ncbi:MAG: HNH endonuclease signature motif containing protein, partial [Candidatus Dormiibacterota bacterium]
SHHFRPWAAGGPTDEENLGLVCGRHHWNHHEGGFVVRENAKGQAEVIRPDGVLYGTVARHRWRRLTKDGP